MEDEYCRGNSGNAPKKTFFLEGGVPLGEILSVLLNCEVLNQAYASEKEL